MTRLLLIAAILISALLSQAILSQSPEIEITDPVPVSELSGTVTIRGTVNLPDLQSYFLEVADFTQDTPQWIPISLPQSRPRIDTELLEWDTTTLPDGVYRLRLHAIACDGEHHFVEVVPLRLANGLSCPIDLPDTEACILDASTPSTTAQMPVTTTPAPPDSEPTTFESIPSTADSTVPDSSVETDPPNDIAAAEAAVTIIDTDRTCENFAAAFEVDLAGFEMPWDAFGQGAFYAYTDEIPFLERVFDTVFEARMDDGETRFENTTPSNAHWQSILDHLPLWVDVGVSTYDIAGYSVEVSANHTRVFESAELSRVTTDSLLDFLPDGASLDADMQDFLKEEAQELAQEVIYMAEIRTTDWHTNGNQVETTVRVQAVYDEHGLLMGAFIGAEYGNCIGCGGEAGVTSSFAAGLGWMSFVERTQAYPPPDECRPVLFGEDISKTQEAAPLSATICPPVADFYATYDESREGVDVGWGGGQIVAIDGRTFTSERGTDTAFIDITAGSVVIPAFTYGDHFPLGGEHAAEATYYAELTQNAYTITWTGSDTVDIDGLGVNVLVYEGERLTTITIESSVMSGALNMTQQHRYEIDAVSGLILRTIIETSYTDCNICSGSLGDYHGEIVGQTRRDVIELVETNQPLGVCLP